MTPPFVWRLAEFNSPVRCVSECSWREGNGRISQSAAFPDFFCASPSGAARPEQPARKAQGQPPAAGLPAAIPAARSRAPRATRARVFPRHQDRLLLGTDRTPSEDRNYFHWLETGDEYFDDYGYSEQGLWKIYARHLPDTVLEEVYHLNAERIFRQFKGPAEQQGGTQ
jgi:hypothetical protein